MRPIWERKPKQRLGRIGRPTSDLLERSTADHRNRLPQTLTYSQRERLAVLRSHRAKAVVFHLVRLLRVREDDVRRGAPRQAPGHLAGRRLLRRAQERAEEPRSGCRQCQRCPGLMTIRPNSCRLRKTSHRVEEFLTLWLGHRRAVPSLRRRKSKQVLTLASTRPGKRTCHLSGERSQRGRCSRPLIR